MSTILRRFPGLSATSLDRPGANPFADQIDGINSQLFIPFTKSTRGIMIFFCTCHVLVSSFCLVILLLPCLRRKKKQSTWFYRRLYINNDDPRAGASKSSLVWVNAGLLMTTTQLVSSTAAQAYIATWLHISQSSTPTYALTEPSFGLMVVSEMLTYWTLMHLFVVTIYYDPKTLANVIIFAVLILFSGIALVHWQVTDQIVLILSILQEGSAAWHGMGSSSTTPEEKVHLGTQLTQVISSAMLVGDRVKKSAERSIHLFRTLVCVMVFLFGVTFLSFIFVFSMLIYQFTRKHNSLGRKAFTSNPFRRWTKSKITASNIEELSNGANQNTIERQFAHLIIRATCIIFAMATSIALFSLGIVKTKEFIFSPYWREVMAWLSTLSCTWSAIPIAWQCWRLYQDELGGTLPNGTCTSATPKIIKEDGVEPKPKPSESESDILIITIHPSCVKASE
ncbi:hypothetical protein MJO28_002512 [Puccinia striiformis f. sp. tritici]|uniref:Uncharacterized protein n=1 Tax=Puccinia striiformis f. sp. tritici TaxID=168172 RepID=A0ACC0EPX1_9BASI|nr:hypothetical protein MJO29_016530 [Puccinia striiformis f. sp. tritici]KAI7958721.1 hypothetical protein MJO28_002512 [Puccinia striiformis f. sp. tritici]